MSPWKPIELLSLIPSSTADKCTAFVKSLIQIPKLLYDFFVWMITAEGNVTREFQNWLGIAVPGDIKATFDTEDQSGWIECNGQEVSRTTYADLFAVIGTAYGAGDGSTTFEVPDLRGRAVGAAGAGTGLTSRAIGETVGEEEHELTESEIPEHSHSLEVNGKPLWAASSTGQEAGSDANPSYSLSSDRESTTATGNYGGATPTHNNMQPTIFARWLIKF